MVSTSCLVLFSVALLSATTATASGEQCRLWLAPSYLSTEHNVKYALYAGVKYAEDDVLPLEEVALPLVDFMEPERSGRNSQRILNNIEKMLWTADFAGAQWEGNHSSTIFVPGIGNLANFHSGTYNVDWIQASVLLREREAITKPGKVHPSRGAITPYYNMTLRATQEIPAGMELFANFGDVWDASDKEPSIYQDRITRWDYADADIVLDHMLKFLDDNSNQLTPELEDNLIDFMLGTILGGALGKRAKVIKSLLPAHPRKLRAVQEAGGTFNYRNADMIRTPQWLERNGICVDKIRAGPSKIPNAGRGVFATEPIEEDEIIVPMPMVPLANEDLLDMYDTYDLPNDKGLAYDYDAPRGKQLAYNYCFGHRESSVVLFPIGPLSALINHSDKPNAKLVWSDHMSVKNDEHLLDVNIDELAKRDHPNLVMNVVALRPIKKDEEITINYGPDWVTAWDDYMKGLSLKHANGKWPLKAEDYRVEYQSKPFPTEEENAHPYADGVATVCFIESDEVEDGNPRRNADGVEILQWYGPKTWEAYSGTNYYPCVVTGRSDKLKDGNLYNYTVIATQNNVESYEIAKVPHRAITFVDEAYTSDIHTPEAFRHWIDIPDDIFPQAWRDLRP